MKRGYIAKCVARAMVEQELTITEAAEIAGVHRTTLGRWLRGEITIRSDHLDDLLEGLGLVVA